MELLREFFPEGGRPAGNRILRRRAVRGIICRNRELFLIYSSVRGDYKFPGGGVKPRETDAQALTREIREECGARVASIGPAFGETVEYRVPFEPDYDLFTMTSGYYLCSLHPGRRALSLDPYERVLGFQPVWVDIDAAIESNWALLQAAKLEKPVWTERETFVLELVRERILPPNGKL